mmetsp:Transcript_40404/g.41048  ORF Transcript_40404/g.41048 Transcript_40404/m.41048 type:complete len:108 (-) Transcript_40404:637-960(-)
MLFLVFPSAIGSLGVLAAYLNLGANASASAQSPINLDRDFIYPFTLTLVAVIVVGFQTNGYTTTERKPLLEWPKAVRTKTIVRKKVIAEDCDFKSKTTGRKKTRKED